LKNLWLPNSANMLQLTTSQIQFFTDHGYLTLDALADVEEVQEIRTTLERLFRERAGENEGAYGDLIAGKGQLTEENSPQILNPAYYAPRLLKTKYFRNALAVARQILGDEARFFLDLSILKKPSIGKATPWHQDGAYRDPRFDYKEVTIWLALQDVCVENGCMNFIPGSHKRPVLEHRSVNDDSTSQALQCVQPFDSSVAIACPLPTGGCTIHDPGILHYAGPNISDAPRFAYIMVFGASPKLRREKRVFKWLERGGTANQMRKRRWMLRGGIFITAWRRLRRGDLDWQSTVYWAKRSIRVLRRGS
jgi:ectoine hydroxylase-related dioxygenase (phytanoyl-CoA dioxygenase family)